MIERNFLRAIDGPNKIFIYYRMRNWTNEVEDHVWNRTERTADSLSRHGAPFFNDYIITYLWCLMEMHNKSSFRWALPTRQEQWVRGKYCFPGKTRTDTQPDDCGDHWLWEGRQPIVAMLPAKLRCNTERHLPYCDYRNQLKSQIY